MTNFAQITYNIPTTETNLLIEVTPAANVTPMIQIASTDQITPKAEIINWRILPFNQNHPISRY